MDKEEMKFNEVLDRLSSLDPEVNEGKMMSSRGIRYKQKVIAFYHDRHMIFRLGRDFDPESEGIRTYEWLNPFKNKPPMKDWFVIGYEYEDKWDLLGEVSLNKMMG